MGCPFLVVFVLFFNQKTSYELRISDWSSDVCSSDLPLEGGEARAAVRALTAPADGGVVLRRPRILNLRVLVTAKRTAHEPPSPSGATAAPAAVAAQLPTLSLDRHVRVDRERSEEHTSELQSLMRISYAVFCLKKKKQKITYGEKTYIR